MQLLNVAISPPGFKYKDLALLAPLLKEGDYITMINLKDGFFHVPVLPSHQTFMSFQWEGKTYVFQVLPFGMSESPWLFTCFVQATVHHLCCQGMRVMAYMDNFIIISHSHQQALEHTTHTLRTLNHLGWQVNFEKPNLMPSQSKEFLGLLVNTTGPPSFKVPPRKSQELQHNIDCLLRLFRQQGQVPVWKLAAVIGQGVALTKAILPAKLLLRNAYHNIAQRANWNSLVPLSAATILDLEDWRHGLSTWNRRLANLQPCNVLLNTEASLTGWGASLGATSSSLTHTSVGWWPPSKQRHINVLKITAVHNALKSFLLLIQGKAVWICCDNIATMAHLNHMGGRSPPMNNVMRTIHQAAAGSTTSNGSQKTRLHASQP